MRVAFSHSFVSVSAFTIVVDELSLKLLNTKLFIAFHILQSSQKGRSFRKFDIVFF